MPYDYECDDVGDGEPRYLLAAMILSWVVIFGAAGLVWWLR